LIFFILWFYKKTYSINNHNHFIRLPQYSFIYSTLGIYDRLLILNCSIVVIVGAVEVAIVTFIKRTKKNLLNQWENVACLLNRKKNLQINELLIEKKNATIKMRKKTFFLPVLSAFKYIESKKVSFFFSLFFIDWRLK